MMNRSDGGPAFPRPLTMVDLNETGAVCMMQDGMTLRDYFAAAAMIAIINKCVARDQETGYSVPVVTEVQERVARGAYAYADAMLKERAK